MDSDTTVASPERAFLDYLGRLDVVFETGDLTRDPEDGADSLPRRFAKLLIPERLRARVRVPRLMVQTDLLALRERRRARALATRSPLLVHLGAGYEVKDGWINVDLVGHPVDLYWNLTRPLPLEADSVDAVFHEHLLEHLALREGYALLCESRRVLKAGGVLRIGVPDAGAYVQSCLAGGRGVIEAIRPGRPTPMLALQEIFFGHGHRAMYDSETLVLLCRAAGFTTVGIKPFGDSSLVPCPDSEHRRAETLYVEMVK